MAVLSRVGNVSFTEMLTFGQRVEESEKVGYMGGYARQRAGNAWTLRLEELGTFEQ